MICGIIQMCIRDRDQTQAKHQSVETLLSEKSRELQGVENQISAAEGQIEEYEMCIRDSR